jgi:hypothetical protein
MLLYAVAISAGGEKARLQLRFSPIHVHIRCGDQIRNRPAFWLFESSSYSGAVRLLPRTRLTCISLTIQLQPSAAQTTFNLKRGGELLADPKLAGLEHRSR